MIDVPSEINATLLDDWFSAVVVHTRPLECFGWYGDDVFLFTRVFRSILWLDCVFPFVLHDFFDTGLTQLAPLPSKPGFTYALEGFVDENTTTKST